jgi:hypothetical protein
MWLIALEKQLISPKWRGGLSALFLAMLAFEVVRLIGRIEIIDYAGTPGIYINLSSIMFILLTLIFTIAGKKLGPFLVSFALSLNFLTTTIYPYNKIENIKVPFSQMVGMPEIVFYLYMLLQIGTIIILVVYYFTDHLYGDESKIKTKSRDADFGKFLTEVIKERKDKHDSIWQD